MLDDHISPVVRGAGFATDVDNASRSRGPYLVGRIALGVAMHRANVDSFVKLQADYPAAGTHRAANESELAALPGLGFFPFEVAVHVHEKILRPSFEQGPIVCGKVDEGLGPRDSEDEKKQSGGSGGRHCCALFGVGLGLGCFLMASLRAARAFFFCSGNSFSLPTIG